MQQAVDGGADYIAVSGQTIDILGTALDAAKSAGIPVIDLYSTDEIGGEENGIYANIGSPDVQPGVVPAARRPDHLRLRRRRQRAGRQRPRLPHPAGRRRRHQRAVRRRSAPTARSQTLDLSITDLTGGTVASQVVSALQSNPDIEYVYVTIGDLATGLPEALASADLGDVKMRRPRAQHRAAAVAGRRHVVRLDAAAPAGVGVGRGRRDGAPRRRQEIDQAQHEVLPIEIWTADNVATPVEEYEGPAGYQDQFTALWGSVGRPSATTGG